MRIRSKGIILVFMCLLVSVSVVSAVRTGPVTVEGNQHCDDLGYSGPVLVKNGPNSETVFNSSDGFSVTVTVTSPQDIAWNSNFPVNAVIVHGSDSNEYVYDPAQTSDTGLTTPANNGDQFHVDHVEFCYSATIVPVPEFPSMALPAGLIMGIIGTVLFLQKTRED